MVIIAQIGGSLSCSLGPRLSLASSPDLDMCEQSPHSLRGLVRPERLPGGVAPQGPRPSQPAHLLLAHVLRSQPINNRSAFAFAFLPFLFGRLGLTNTWSG